MTKVTIIYPAKCKDCLYCKAFYISDVISLLNYFSQK